MESPLHLLIQHPFNPPLLGPVDLHLIRPRAIPMTTFCSELSTEPSESESESESDTKSDSSSVIYVDQEPLITFQVRVLDFALHKIWPDAASDEIVVERMVGGGFNRIIGVSWQPRGNPEPLSRYILRIPRYADQPVASQVTILQFLVQYCRIPAPLVVDHDDTDNNELGSKYMIQNRVPGSSLLWSYPALTHPERCKVARELGSVFREMLATSSTASGVLVPSTDKSAPLSVLSWHQPNTALAVEYAKSSIPQDIHKILEEIFTNQKHSELKERPNAIIRPHLIDCFCMMSSELAADGWFSNCRISLAHLDLEPRNILVNPDPNSDRPIISAIVDWDSAVFAPQFMCCAPPLWLWAWKDDEDEDERTANDVPPTPEARQIKQLFEEAAGSDYIRFAYPSAYRLARRLVRFAIDGLKSNEDYENAEDMLEEWKTLSSCESGLVSLMEQHNNDGTPTQSEWGASLDDDDDDADIWEQSDILGQDELTIDEVEEHTTFQNCATGA